MKNINHYAILADLFEYPGPDFPDKVMKAQEVLNEKYPDAANLLQPFTEFISKATYRERDRKSVV